MLLPTEPEDGSWHLALPAPRLSPASGMAASHHSPPPTTPRRPQRMGATPCPCCPAGGDPGFPGEQHHSHQQGRPPHGLHPGRALWSLLAPSQGSAGIMWALHLFRCVPGTHECSARSPAAPGWGKVTWPGPLPVTAGCYNAQIHLKITKHAEKQNCRERGKERTPARVAEIEFEQRLRSRQRRSRTGTLPRRSAAAAAAARGPENKARRTATVEHNAKDAEWDAKGPAPARGPQGRAGPGRAWRGGSSAQISQDSFTDQ